MVDGVGLWAVGRADVVMCDGGVGGSAAFGGIGGIGSPKIEVDCRFVQK